MKINQTLKPDEKIITAIDLFDIADYEQAINVCTEIISEFPSYARAYMERGYNYEELDRLEEALTDYQKVLSLDPSYPGIRESVATLQSYFGDSENTVKTL